MGGYGQSARSNQHGIGEPNVSNTPTAHHEFSNDMNDAGALPSAIQVERVLVPLDGSDFALRALPTALELANRFNAELHTISLATSSEELEQLGALIPFSLRAFPGEKHVRVEMGRDPAEAIVRRAGELKSCLVCLTTQGRGRLTGAVMGSVARSVIRRALGGTVALGPLADNPGWSPPPSNWPKPLSIPRMVACVDGSDTSEEVLPMAAAWALALGMSLTILTVVSDTREPMWSEMRPSRYGRHAEPETYIESLVERWKQVLPATDGAVVFDPIGPASGIRIHLDQKPTGLIAVTTHARSGMQRVRFGAHAASIVRASVAPCLVAPVAGLGTNIRPSSA
jgi:nucleotide-binding universal stress UspA family protein